MEFKKTIKGALDIVGALMGKPDARSPEPLITRVVIAPGMTEITINDSGLKLLEVNPSAPGYRKGMLAEAINKTDSPSNHI